MKRTKFHLLTISLLVICHCSYAQDKNEIIKEIRKEYVRINALNEIHKISLDADEFLEEMPDGGAELTGYFRKDTLLKISEWVGLSYGNQTREFYFRNDQLFFVYEKFEAFVQTASGLDHSKAKKCFEGRYYFDKNKPIEKTIEGKKPMDNGDGDIIRELREEATSDREVLLEKKKQGR